MEDSMKESHEICDQLSYGMGIQKERSIYILFDIGLEYISTMIKTNTGVMHHLKMYDYIKSKYKDVNENFYAAYILGRISSDKSLKRELIMLHISCAGNKDMALVVIMNQQTK